MSDFKVQGKLGLDGAGFFSTLNQARGAVSSFGGMLAGAFSVGAIASFTKGVISLAGKLNDVSDALSINVEFLQRFINSAKLSGGSIESVEKFIATLQRSRQEAVNNPTGKEAMAFGALGIGKSDISKASNQKIMEMIISSFASGVTIQKSNALYEVGGKAADKLIGGFRDGLSDKPFMTEEQISLLDEIGDTFDQLGTDIQTTFAPAILAVADALSTLYDFIQSFVAGIAATVEEMRSGDDNNKKLAEDKANRDEQLARVQKKIDAARDAGLLTAEEADKKMEDITRKSKLGFTNISFVAAASEEFMARQEEREKAKEERAAARANKRNGQDIVPTTNQASKSSSFDFRHGDSRLAIGGLFGQGGGDQLGSIARRQLESQLKSQDYLKTIAESYKGSSIIVPK